MRSRTLWPRPSTRCRLSQRTFIGHALGVAGCFYRSVPATTMSTRRLPHSPQTSRHANPGRPSRHRSARPSRPDRARPYAANPTPHDEPHSGGRRVAERHRRAAIDVHSSSLKSLYSAAGISTIWRSAIPMGLSLYCASLCALSATWCPAASRPVNGMMSPDRCARAATADT